MNRQPPSAGASPKPFLGVYFADCGVYGRLYRQDDGRAYQGRCPSCGQTCRVRVGAGGTTQRFFIAHCR
ncbi:MAG: hypothetical protein ACFB20_06685 [Opitutales bacterium]